MSLLCEGDSGGVLVQNEAVLSVQDMAYLLHENENVLHESIDVLVQTGLMEILDESAYSITRFMEDQGSGSFGEKVDKTREKWRKAQAKHRNKQKANGDSDADVELNTDTDKDTDVTQKSSMTSTDKYFITDTSSISSTPNQNANKRQSLQEEIKNKLEKGLNINADNAKWFDFINFACERQEKYNEPVDKFIAWVKKDGIELIYFPPEKLKTFYPRAFLPEEQFIKPLPPRLPEDKKALTYEEASKAGYFRKKNLTGLEG